MGLFQKVGRFVVGGRSAIKDPTAVLREAYADAVRRHALLAQHTELAPQEYSRKGLSILTKSAVEQVASIRTALRQRGIGLPPEPPPLSSAASLSHWARLVEDLELHRASARRLRELAFHFAETDAATAQIFDQLCQEDLRSCERLRVLIARADPQARD